MPYFSNKRLRRLAVGMLVVCAIAPLPAYAVSDAIVRQGPKAVVMLALVIGLSVGFVLSYLLAVAVHEIGQLMACKLIGWDIYLLGIWPFLVRFEPFALRFGRIPGKYSTGSVLAFPPSPEKQTKWRVALFNRAGVVANLLCAAAAVAVLVAAPRSLLLVGFVVPIGLLSLLVAATSLQTAYKSRHLSPFGVARLKGLGLYASGIAPEQWDTALVATLEAGTQSGSTETDTDATEADVLLYERYFDLHEYEKARGALDRAISRTRASEKMWDGLCTEDAFFSAFVERNIPRAQEALAKLDLAKHERYYPYRRALAAIAIARGDRAEALRLLRGGPYRSSNPFMRQTVRRVHAMVVSEAECLAS